MLGGIIEMGQRMARGTTHSPCTVLSTTAMRN
jgi:hypothetical protein